VETTGVFMEEYRFLLMNLANKFGTLFMFAFIVSNLKPAREFIYRKPVSVKDKVLLSIVFGIFGIIGTYFSVEFNGALINTRIIGVATGGLLGGPVVGLASGTIAAIHRYLMPTGKFTQLACAVSVPLEGLVAGLFGLAFRKRKNLWIHAAFVGAVCESMRKISVLIFSKPFPQAVDLVKDIWIPMVIINSIGLALLFLVIENIFRDRDRIGAEQVNLSINIIDKLLPYIKGGLSEENSAVITDTIYEMTTFDAVTITAREKIIAHSGIHIENHEYGNKVNTERFNTIMESGETLQFDSTIISPIRDGDDIIGTVKYYKKPENIMNNVDREIAWGLARLLSSQIKIGRLEKNSKLLVEAELKALQAQINPHFLFNSLTVIASLCRTNAMKARELILHLSNHFRNNLTIDRELVNLEVELSHVKSYVEIEMARFEDKLKVEYDIEEGIDCLLPPLTLQPLVENAIKHGILPQKEGGYVRISASMDGDLVSISIFDNGVGIPHEIVEKLNDKKVKHIDSIGLNNVNQRLIGKFGPDFSLVIESELGTCTEMIIKAPGITKIENHEEV
jgi:two-component system sensor histidine kinase LytS